MFESDKFGSILKYYNITPLLGKNIFVTFSNMSSLITQNTTKSYKSKLQSASVCSVDFETMLTSIAVFEFQECSYNYIIM